MLLVSGEQAAYSINPPPPTAKLKFNGKSSLTVRVGDSVTIAWSSTGGSTAKSTYDSDVPACNSDNGPAVPTGTKDYLINDLSGTQSLVIFDCMAGVTYTVKYYVTNSSGIRTSAVAALTVLSKDQPVDEPKPKEPEVVRKIEGISLSAPGQQHGAQFSISRVNELAANATATEAAIDCMSAANSAKLQDSGSAGEAVASCQNRFDAANTLQNNSQSALNNIGEGQTAAPLTADEEILSSERAQSVIAEFEENFKQDGREFIDKLIGEKGNRSVFAELEGKGLTGEQILKAMAAADALGTNPDAVLATVEAKKSGLSGLRDSLKKKLQEDGGRSLASLKAVKKEVAVTQKKNDANLKNLEKLDPDQVFGLTDRSDTELNLFEIMRQRMRELTVKHKL